VGTAKHCLAILVLFLVPAYDALAYEYTWEDYRKPFTELVRVPSYTHGTSTVYLDLPQDTVNSHESITLHLDIASNFLFSIDGSARKSFEGWSAYCSVNSAGFFGKHRIRVNDLPERQTSSISIRTKDLKAGRNTLEFSMAANDNRLRYTFTGSQVPIVFGIHKMWFSEFSTPSQEPTIEKAKDAPVDKSKPYDVWSVKSVSTSPLDSRGNKCGEANAILYVQGNVAKGTGKTAWGGNFEVSGSVDSEGRVNVGSASGNNIFATFTGVMSGDSATGIWQDQTQCYGTWTATKQKQIEPSTKPGHTDIETKLMELKQLLDKGLINQEDYNRKKAELLDQL
jgi:hypothetical protein